MHVRITKDALWRLTCPSTSGNHKHRHAVSYLCAVFVPKPFLRPAFDQLLHRLATMKVWRFASSSPCHHVIIDPSSPFRLTRSSSFCVLLSNPFFGLTLRTRYNPSVTPVAHGVALFAHTVSKPSILRCHGRLREHRARRPQPPRRTAPHTCTTAALVPDPASGPDVSNHTTVLKFLVNNNDAGHIIGKRGATVNELQVCPLLPRRTLHRRSRLYQVLT